MPIPAYLGLWSANAWLHLTLPEALASLGVGVVALPTDCPEPLLQHYVHTAALQVLICDPEHAAQACQCRPDLARIVIQPDMTGSAEVIEALRALGVGLSSPPAGSPPLTMLFSSGTNGLPRAVLRSASADQFRMQQFRDHFRLHAGLRHIVAGPLYHSGPAIFARTHRYVGCDLILHPHFDADRVLDLLADAAQPIFTLFLVPTQLRKLELARARRGVPWSVYDSVARLWVAGSRFEADLKQLFALQLAPDTLWEFYGATETGTISIQSQAQMLHTPDSVGRPVPGVTLSVRDIDGQELPTGMVGRIWVHSPMNAAAVLGGMALEQDDSGYLCLGDCGWLDADGALYLTGREADMMISGGVNVYPAQVEDALRATVGVADALAYGVADPLWGERIEALVVARDGNPREASNVLDELRNRLPAAARPKALHWVEALPLTPSGKPSRQAARKLAKNLL